MVPAPGDGPPVPSRPARLPIAAPGRRLFRGLPEYDGTIWDDDTAAVDDADAEDGDYVPV